MSNEELNLNKTRPAPANEGSKLLAGGLALALVIVLIIGAIVLSKNHRQRLLDAGLMENQKTEMASQISQRDSIINEWVLAFNEIETNIKKNRGG